MKISGVTPSISTTATSELSVSLDPLADSGESVKLAFQPLPKETSSSEEKTTEPRTAYFDGYDSDGSNDVSDKELGEFLYDAFADMPK